MSASPIIQKPKQPVAFPPVNHLRPYRVRDGDNWWTLQKSFGLRDPWDLIRYNFETENPAEVNWYLREYVGCTKVTADGKNYCFSSSATPGLLYLPRRNTKRGIGSGTGVSPAEQATNDGAARKKVRWALAQSKVLQHVHFTFGGVQVTHSDFDRVLRLIDEDQIYVVHYPEYGNDASYDSGTDTFYIGDVASAPSEGADLIIHEATHAAFDARGVAILDVSSEAVGYIAQMLFRIVREPKLGPPYSDDPESRAVFLPAWRYAKRIRDKQLDKHDSKEPLAKTMKDLQELVTGLLAHEKYKQQFRTASELYNDESGYDGVRGWIYWDAE